jgi:hypothetical protein
MFSNYHGAIDSPLLMRFAARVIVEWCCDRCPDCGGTKLAGVSPDEAHAGVLLHRRCPKCIHHPGKAGIDHVARALALDLPGRLYHRHFQRRFAWAHEALKRMVRGLKLPVATQLERRELAILDEED